MLYLTWLKYICVDLCNFDKSACCVRAQNWFISGGLSLDCKRISAPFDQEFTLVTPSWTVGVSHDPVFESGFRVSTPSDDYN